MAEPFSMAPDFSWVDEGNDPVQAAAEVAAARTRNAVRSHYGRPEGKATQALDALGTGVYNAAARPSRIWGALNALQPGEALSDHPEIADAGAALSLDLLGAPAMTPGGIVKGAAGIFGGKLAQTADHAKLARAESMAEQGATPSMIRDATGWHQGVDGKWRFEIDDSGSVMRPGLRSSMGDQLFHPALYDAYPDLKDIKMLWGSPPRQGHYERPLLGDERISLSQFGDDQRSVALHELQHAVQQREGFALGANPNQYTQQPEAELARDALSFRRELDQQPKGLDTSNKENNIVGEYQKLGAMDMLPSRQARDLAHDRLGNPDDQLQELVKLYGLDKKVTPSSPRDLYKRTAGEVEARNVQKRMNWNGLRRDEVPPAYSQDVPNADQILQLPDSKPVPMSMSPGAKPSREAISDFSDQLKQKHGLSHLSIYPTNAGDLNLSMIEVPREMRKQGIGTAALRDIVDYADQSGMRLTLTPGLKDSRHGTTSRGRLVDFYKQFGFVENKGRNKDFTISEGMYRPAKRGD